MAPQKKPQITKLPHFHRSAIAPVGIVAVVSMKATMYRNQASTPASIPAPESAQPPFHRNTQFPSPIRALPTGAPRPPKYPDTSTALSDKGNPMRKNPMK